MDFGSLIGVISGMGMVFGAILYEGNLEQFINVPGMMIVMGGYSLCHPPQLQTERCFRWIQGGPSGLYLASGEP